MRHSGARVYVGFIVLVSLMGVGRAQDTTGGGKMYWTDAGTDKIQRANLDGSAVEDLIMIYSSGPAAGGGKRRGLALDLGR